MRFKKPKTRHDAEAYVVGPQHDGELKICVKDMGHIRYTRKQRKQVAKRLEIAAKLVRQAR